ncbi:unnamed protein product [Anisakis simplex]|uniref:Uncharacterized protein n=1 Tax=Anisakis simplex TaxID=6269 RepID=A0A0M3JTW9_ANISI|nr:unnamed protein product [Anisakis simplex]
MVINRASIIPEEANTLNSGSTSLKLRSDFKQDMSSSYSPSLNQMSSIGFEQVANIQRGVGVMCAGGDGSLRRDRQRFEQLLMNDVACNKLFGATRNVTDAAAPVPNALLDATSASDNTQLCAACTTTAPTTTSCVNPFVLAAAALSMQQQQNTTTQQPQFAWNANTNTSDEQQLNSSSYFQQLHAHAQQVMLLQQLITAQQLLSAATQSSSNQQHADQQWLSQSLSQPSATNFNVNLLRRGSLSSSTASSYASSSSCASSPILLNNSDEEISELSAQSQQTDHDTTSPFRETVLSSQDDDRFMMDSLIELRKDLSEKESIAVAVLAGMAACQR